MSALMFAGRSLNTIHHTLRPSSRSIGTCSTKHDGPPARGQRCAVRHDREMRRQLLRYADGAAPATAPAIQQDNPNAKIELNMG